MYEVRRSQRRRSFLLIDNNSVRQRVYGVLRTMEKELWTIETHSKCQGNELFCVFFSFRKSELCVHTTHIYKRFEAQAHSIDVRNAHESIHDMHILFSFQLWKYNKREPNTSENNKKPKNWTKQSISMAWWARAEQAKHRELNKTTKKVEMKKKLAAKQ